MYRHESRLSKIYQIHILADWTGPKVITLTLKVAITSVHHPSGQLQQLVLSGQLKKFLRHRSTPADPQIKI